MSTGFELSAVVKRFGSRRHPHVAVDGVDDRFAPGRTYGIIGQSGSGKSTLGRILCGLETASSGSVRYDGEELVDVLRSRDRRRAFRRAVQMISQDTTSSFDPKRSLRESIVFPAVHLLGMSTRDAWERADEVLLAVGLDPTLAARAPGAVSGGQRQRFSIARALVVRPSMLICDEVVSALDVSVQGGILNFLKQYVAETGAGIVFISHGLPATAFVSDEIRVMYRGRFVERGDARTVVTAPRHEYTTRLLAGYAPTPTTKEAAVA